MSGHEEGDCSRQVKPRREEGLAAAAAAAAIGMTPGSLRRDLGNLF